MAEISASDLLVLRARVDDMFTNSPQQLGVHTDSTTAQAILDNQTARFNKLDDYRKDNKIEVTWIDSCLLEVADCDDNCDLDEPELSTGAITYEPDLCKKSGFKVNETQLRGNDYNLDDFVVRGVAGALSKLDEWWAQQALSKLKTFAGVNIDPNPLIEYDDVTKSSSFEIPLDPADYTSVYNRLLMLMRNNMVNRMIDPYYVNDGSLWLPFASAQMRHQDAGGQGNLNILNQFDMSFDMLNFAKVGLDEHTFAISKGAVAMKTVNKNAPSLVNLGGSVGQTRYRVSSPTLQGVEYDAYYTLKCVDNEIFHIWRFETNGLIELSPLGCEIDFGGEPVQQTGVLAYAQPTD